MGTPGEIYNMDRYMRGKLTQSKSWYGKLPRKITPSDVDLVFDDHGRYIFVEFSSRTARWESLDTGQQLLHQGLVKLGGGKINAVCCRHADVPLIDTLSDVVEFQVMYLHEGVITYSPIHPGRYWERLVLAFYGQT